ncbi:DUF389 domain-containing protein [Ilumatobacter sp.]|uniref:DUF389 domain-containing protein n=1 Tax=Ilumatobacter sp. TaxID=1967498 RepID=UPI003B52E377
MTTGERSTGPAPAGARGRSQTAIGGAARWVGSVLPTEPDADARRSVDELIPHQGPALRDFLVRFCALIALSASIASFGLLSDSGAVVIGAMLVAPLMTPIMAAAAATVTADDLRLARSLGVIVVGTALAVAFGWAVSLLAGGSVIDVSALPAEIRGRTFPGLLDLGVAITAGAAGGYVQPRRSAISALPGVGIAVALVPPLATAGITLELGLVDEAANAVLLYLTNLAAIVFAAGLVLAVSGFRPPATLRRGVLRRRVLVTALAVAAVAVPLFRHTASTVRDMRLRSSVVESVEDWHDEARIVTLSAETSGGTADVELVVVGVGESPPAWSLAQRIRDRVDGPVELRLLYQSDELSVVSAR